jgi:hypothetical protein
VNLPRILVTVIVVGSITVYITGVAMLSQTVSKELRDPESGLAQTAREFPVLACSVAALVIYLWPVVLPLGALLYPRSLRRRDHR